MVEEVKFKVNGKNYEINPLLAKTLDKIYKQMKKDDDCLCLIVGPEGVGKSKFRDLIGGYWQHLTQVKFKVDNIHFTSSEYMKFALKQKPFTFVSHDETRRDLNTMRSMGKASVEFTNYLSECRDNNQFHCLILPAFSDITKYVALWRTKLLIEIGKVKDKHGEYQRGLFRVVKTNNKKKLSFYHKNKYTKFPKSMIAFTGKFKDNEVIPKEEYKNKKQRFKELKYIESETKNLELTSKRKEFIINAVLEYKKLFNSKSKEYKMGSDIQKLLGKHDLRPTT